MDDVLSQEIRGLLESATNATEALQARIEAGEDVSDEEIAAVARSVAEAIEEANTKLREVIGPIDSALLREKAIEDLSPEEFDRWSEDNAALMEYRAQREKESRGG